ncbi:SidA/IucD/PvdA family monooxygenase [Jatrophihabitans sp.]|jgi:lysine N6-hydroxylase|uniref:SidA/IucD/PvdA family monooxygenase n=1 Tax=Jatrophihabitans sp. TaxID=1932789 RepID=UPI002F1213B6
MTSNKTDLPYFSVVGIGAGPANLSLAALLQARTDQRIALFDKAADSSWHSSLLHPGVRMQTSWMKDLVSLVDPTHKLSFLNYLVTEGRLFAMINSQFDVIPRREYMRYLAWASGQIENIHYSTPIEEVSFVEGEGFYAISGGAPVARSQHLVIGVGTRPTVPAGLSSLPDDRAFIADHLALHLPTMSSDKTAPVAVIGGGQTGIEAVLRLLGAGFSNIKWLGRRQWFQTIDDSPAANEIYRPAHQQYLQDLTRGTRRRLVEDANPTGDALTPGVLRTLYQANYDRMLEFGEYPVAMLPGRDVTEGVLDGKDVVLHCSTAERLEQHRVAYAVIAVGRQSAPVPFSAELRERLDAGEDGDLVIEEDYSVRWKGMDDHRIYALNRARFSHGIPDANLTLLPVRAAMVINSMLGSELFQIRDELCPVQWG